MNTSILIVEDKFIEANNLKLILRKAGYSILPIAHSVSDALEIMAKQVPDIVMLDILLEGRQTGIDLAVLLREKNIAFVYLSANSDARILNMAISTKPYGFLVKPFREKDVLIMLDVARYRHQHDQQSIMEQPAPVAAIRDAFANIVGTSPNFKEVVKNVQRVAPSETSVLILGESGTGKELIAQAIHRLSPRRAAPLIVVNCAALPANLIEAELFGHEKGSFTGAMEKRIGKFEQADGGTIFLDEIGELPLDLQVKFLRVLQEREIEPIGGKKKKVDVRVIAATNRNLEEEIAKGRFRLDLYYRLNVFPVFLPSLRERREDILPLANYFLSIYAEKEKKTIIGISEKAAKTILAYPWPGNIRELENLMARSVILCDGSTIETIQLSVDGKNLPVGHDRLKTMTENERDHILAALDKCDWKVYGKGGAAEILQINASTLYSRMQKLGIQKRVGPKETDW